MTPSRFKPNLAAALESVQKAIDPISYSASTTRAFPLHTTYSNRGAANAYRDAFAYQAIDCHARALAKKLWFWLVLCGSPEFRAMNSVASRIYHI